MPRMSYHAYRRRLRRIECASSEIMWAALLDPTCNERSAIWRDCEAREERLLKLARRQWNASRVQH